MAADLTFIAIDDTPGNRHLADLKTGRRLFYDDENVYDPETGALLGQWPGNLRTWFERSWYEREFVEYDWFEVGPTAHGGPVAALQEYWNDVPRRLTLGRIKHTMVLMNLPDGAYRRYWRPGANHGYKWRKRWHVPWPGGRRSGRCARRQHVRSWLLAHKDQLVWTEAW